MFRLMFLVVFSLLAASALSGYTTVLLIEAATETVTKKYVVDGADGAWLGENGDLTVCLYGQAPRRPSADFAVFIPAADFAVSDAARPLAAYRIPPNRIATLCDQPPEGARVIPTEFVDAAGDPGPQREQYWQPAPDREPNPDQEPAPDQEQESTPEQEPGPGGDQGLVTTILDHETAPAHELAALYHERWEIETALDELKTHLRGARIVLRSKTPDRFTAESTPQTPKTE